MTDDIEVLLTEQTTALNAFAKSLEQVALGSNRAAEAIEKMSQILLKLTEQQVQIIDMVRRLERSRSDDR